MRGDPLIQRRPCDIEEPNPLTGEDHIVDHGEIRDGGDECPQPPRASSRSSERVPDSGRSHICVCACSHVPAQQCAASLNVEEQEDSMNPNTRMKLTVGGVALAGALAGGAVVATTMPVLADAATAPSPGATSDTPQGPHQANGITEQPLTGDVADKARAAVLAEYPDATIQRMETDAEGAAYEAHILQADGTPATVKLDDSFTIIGLETGGPGGGHRGSGGDDSTSGFDTST
jgi:hypothetical protein